MLSVPLDDYGRLLKIDHKVEGKGLDQFWNLSVVAGSVESLLDVEKNGGRLATDIAVVANMLCDLSNLVLVVGLPPDFANRGTNS